MRYAHYKDSGIEWIGKIPQGWSVKRLKVLANIQTGNTPPKEQATNAYYSDNGFLWVKPDNLSAFNLIIDTKEKLNEEGWEIARVVPPFTPLVCCIGTIGKFGLSSQSVAFNQQINAVMFNEKMLSRFGLYFISCQEEQHWFYANGNVVQILNSQNQGQLRFPCPPIQEQQQITDYLDKKCEKIDRVIEIQKSIIERLKEYKQSVITEAVTKGLDKSVPLKDSGIEWIGEIPQEWKVEKLKNLFIFCKGLSITKDNLISDGIAVISYGQIHSKFNTGTHISNDLIRFVSDSYLEENNLQSLVNRGDFIFADTSEDIEGAGNYVFIDKEMILFAGYHSIILKNKFKNFILGRYLSYLFQAIQWRAQIRARVNGIKVYSISQKILKEITIIMPNQSEQQQIANYLDKKCAQIDKTIADKELMIEKLIEYKKSLIYECVTGKRKVV